MYTHTAGYDMNVSIFPTCPIKVHHPFNVEFRHLNLHLQTMALSKQRNTGYGLPGGAPRRLCATVGMVGRAVGAVGSVRVGIVRVGSDGMLSVGSRTWSTSSQGGNGAALVAALSRSGICVWLSYFSYISWRALSLTLVIDGSNQLLKSGTRVLWTCPILKVVGCSMQIGTLNSSINQHS